MPVNITTKLTVKDRGWLAIRDRLRDLNGQFISVGIVEPQAAQLEPGRRGKPASATVGEVAVAMELDPPPGVPRRPFISRSFDRHMKQLRADLRVVADRVIEGASAVDALAEFADGHVQDIKAEIDLGIPPENSPATVREKGSDTPLIDTGTLQESVNYRISKTRPTR